VVFNQANAENEEREGGVMANEDESITAMLAKMRAKRGWPRLDTEFEEVLTIVMKEVKTLHANEPLYLTFVTPLISGIEEHDINQVYFLALHGADELTEANVRAHLKALQTLGFVAELEMCEWTPHILSRPEWSHRVEHEYEWPEEPTQEPGKKVM